MVKRFGAIDRVLHRKKRSDKGKKRKKYRGKPILKRKKRYDRRLGNKDSIKIWAWWRVSMTRDGYKNWKSHLRPKLHKEVTNLKATKPIRVDVSEINTKAKIEDFIARNYWSGKFVIMGCSHGKTKTHFKWVKICTIIVRETPEGNVGKMVENKRLSKYRWFWRG